MITKEKIKGIAENYLSKSNLEYSSLCDLENIQLSLNEKISYGKYEGKIKEIYLYHFGQTWGLDEVSLTLHIDAKSGELLYIITPHSYLDVELENDQ